MRNAKRWALAWPCAGILAAPAVLVCSTVLAAEPAAKPEEQKGVVEEIIVTSRREAESQQTVPVAVTAFTQQDIDRVQPNTLKDMDGLIPNVFIGHQTAGPQMGAIFIRGLGYQDVEKNVPPAVGVIVDDVVVGTNTGQLIDMFDVAQMEVNRGPQGVLYGKNTTGGTIVVHRVEPKLNEFGGAVSAEYGDYSEQIYKGRINIPLVQDALALKIGGIVKSQDGFYDNPTFGHIGDVDYRSLTASLLFEPSDAFRAKLTYDRLDDNSDSVAMDARYNGDSPFRNENDWNAQTDYEQNMWGLVVDADVGSARLSSITGYIDEADLVGQDFDSTGVGASACCDANDLPYASVPLAQLHTLRDATYKQLSEELRLSGDLTDSLHYTIGGFYMDAEIDLKQTTNLIAQLPNFIFNPADPVDTGCSVFGQFVVPGFLFPHPTLGNRYCQTPYVSTPGGRLGDNTGGLGFQQAKEDSTSTAAFGALRWNATDALEIAGGVRWLKDDKKFKNNFVGTGVATPAGFPVSDQNSWDDFIFELTTNYRITDRNMVYAKYAEGYRSGGYAIRSNNVNQLTYDPENVSSYEIGSKNDLFDERVRLNLTAFYTDMKDYQYGVVIQTPTLAPGTTTPINNAPNLEVKGFEVDAVFALIQHFTVIASAGWQDGERKGYLEDPTRLPIGPNGTPGSPSQCPAAGCALPKIDLPRTPDWNWALTGMVDWTMGQLGFDASVSAHGQDDVLIVGSNLLTGQASADLVQDGYTLVDARLAVSWPMSESDTLSLAVYGKNLTDEEYYDFILPLGGPNTGFQGWGNPRMWGVEVKWSR